jgi:putative restriction endonuclease
VRGYIAHTDHGWWRFLKQRPALREVNFWRPGGRRFAALAPGEPLFFRLKSPIDRIGGFGLFARFASLPVWRAWEVFGEANGVTGEATLLERLGRLARRPVSIADSIGCIAVSECVFLDPDDWIELPASFRPQNLSGSALDLDQGEGRALWTQSLERAASSAVGVGWTGEALDRERAGQPQLVIPRLGQGSFRLAVMDAYGGGCAITSEHSMPALEAVHIRPWSLGGQHEVSNGLPLRRDIHRLFDLGYMSARPDGRLLVSPRLQSEFANVHTYYALEDQRLARPTDPTAAPSTELLAWHSETVFRAS